MKKYCMVLFAAAVVLSYCSIVHSYEVADSFIFPIDGYTDDGCFDWGVQTYRDGILKNHVGDDYCVPEGTDVIAIGNGRIKFTLDDPTGRTLYPRYWYGLMVMEHTKLNGDKVCSIYGHAKPVEVDINGEFRKLQVGDEVVKGQKIGEIVNYPPSSEHIHFGIYNGAYITEEGEGSTLGTWLFGYCLPENFPGNYLDPIAFIQSHQPDLTRGLIAHYPFNGNADDESGNENHGTVYGATLTIDRFGNPNSAYSFDGDDYIFCPTVGRYEKVSWTGWFKTIHDYSSEGATIFEVRGAGGVWLANDNKLVGILEPGYAHWEYIYSPSICNDGKWYFAALTYDRLKMTFYLNGVKIDSINNTNIINYDGNGFWIGRCWWKDAHFFNGIIDDIRIYNRALSETEIQRLFNQLFQGEEIIYEQEMIIGQEKPFEKTFNIFDWATELFIFRIIGGSDVETSLIQPNGAEINRENAQDLNVYHVLTSIYEAYQINNPMPGQWTVKLKGTDVPDEGELTNLIVSINTIADEIPPEISLSVSPDTLWSPNHKMVLITPEIIVVDNCDPNPIIELVLITMNEGDENDIQVDENGDIWLRAERLGTGTGRIYTITYTATDASGNSASASATVTVPHNQ